MGEMMNTARSGNRIQKATKVHISEMSPEHRARHLEWWEQQKEKRRKKNNFPMLGKRRRKKKKKAPEPVVSEKTEAKTEE
tara:strand:+ start:148 stop:387 length:240 start_codon:yes stop_codon:yes gene_type:complete